MDKIYIWGENIPFNTGRDKLADMIIRKRPKMIAMAEWLLAVFGSRISRDTGAMDTFTFLDEIRPGKMSTRYDDRPNLIPFLSPGSDTAVIIAPGGGFCNQSREREGYDIAEFLNTKGISAFVLEYRLNPYRAPAPYLDMQRAVRFVRFHAAEYGIDPDKIGSMGFSAGGYIAGAAAVLLGNAPVEYEGYTQDEVDRTDGRASFVGMVYPVICFEENANMLPLLAGSSFFENRKRKELMKQYSLIQQLKKSEIPQFLCYGTRDRIKGGDTYGRRLEELGIPHKTVRIEGAGHGFALSYKKYAFWADLFARWIHESVKTNTD